MIESKLIDTFPYTIQKVWDVVTNNEEYSWRKDIARIEIVDQNNFIEYTKNNYPTKFKITKKDFLKQYKFEMENSNLTGEWIGIFKKIDERTTQIEFIERVKVNNFIMKLFARSYLKKQQKIYVGQLMNKLKETKDN